MKIQDTPIEGLKVIELKVFADDRGFFTERFKDSTGINENFLQDNHSRSYPNVVRGLHYQRNPDQAKLVSCITGKIYDVAVDIRKDSKTFGQHFGIELDETRMLYIPAGFAHGFCVVGDQNADVMYKVDGYWNGAGEGCIKFDDAELGIVWPVKNPIVSAKDQQGMSFAAYKANPVF